MNFKLVVHDDRYVYRVGWRNPEDDCVDAYLGQSSGDGKGKPPKDRDDWERWAASRAVAESPEVRRDNRGFYWDGLKDAKGALALAKAVLAAGVGRELPDWAKQALAAGWKAPKGWKP